MVALSRRQRPAAAAGQYARRAGAPSPSPSSLFILATSNPFTRVVPAPAEGQDLNPILQDLGLAIHPPLLYVGYVGFSITFAFACAALIDGRIDAVWARAVRPWTLTAWAFLTARHRHGLLLGLLRTRLGRLVVLGSGRERLAHAVARRHRAGAFDRRDGEARRAEGLDDPARDPDLLALAARHLPGPLRRADLGAFLRGRSRRAASSSSASWSSSSAARWRCSPGARRCCSRAASSRRSRARARSSSTTCSSPPPAPPSSSARSIRWRSR